MAGDLTGAELEAAGLAPRRRPRFFPRFLFGLGGGLALAALVAGLAGLWVAGQLFEGLTGGLQAFVDALWGH